MKVKFSLSIGQTLLIFLCISGAMTASAFLTTLVHDLFKGEDSTALMTFTTSAGLFFISLHWMLPKKYFRSKKNIEDPRFKIFWKPLTGSIFLLGVIYLITPVEIGIFSVILHVCSLLISMSLPVLFSDDPTILESSKKLPAIPGLSKRKNDRPKGSDPHLYPAFTEESVMGDFMRKSWEDIKMLSQECKGLKAHHSDQQSRKLLALFQSIFFTVLAEPRRFTSASRKVLSNNLKTVYRVSRNLGIELNKFHPDQEVIDKAKTLLDQAAELIKHSSDNLYQAENKELITDIQLLEDEVAGFDWQPAEQTP